MATSKKITKRSRSPQTADSARGSNGAKAAKETREEQEAFLHSRGWGLWYRDDYWVHPKTIQDQTVQDYTNYGMSLAQALTYEREGGVASPPFWASMLGLCENRRKAGLGAFHEDDIRREGLPEEVFGLLHDLCYHHDGRNVYDYVRRAQEILKASAESAATAVSDSEKPNESLGTGIGGA